MTLASGTRLGPYEIVAPIGAGGMGEVYRSLRLDLAAYRQGATTRPCRRLTSPRCGSHDV